MQQSRVDQFLTPVDERSNESTSTDKVGMVELIEKIEVEEPMKRREEDESD